MDEFQKAVLRRLDSIERNQSIFEDDRKDTTKLLEDVQINFTKVHGEMQALKEEMEMVRKNIAKNTKTTIDSADKTVDIIVEKIEETNGGE